MYNMTEYKVYVDGKYIDTVSEDNNISEDLVRIKYIRQYGYSTIVVAQSLQHKKDIAWNVSR